MSRTAAERDGWVLRAVKVPELRALFELHHRYKGVGATATYAFGAYEDERLVAAFTWQPPPVGCAKSVLPECPSGVLSLSRMVAVPRAGRRLRHLSNPLRVQMHHLIDRTRWPALVTFSDEGQGHTGHVYLCSGWTKTTRAATPNFEDEAGSRTSKYQNGATSAVGLVRAGWSVKQRWEHHAVPPEQAMAHMLAAGWVREPVPGKVWASGNPAYRWRKA